MEEFRGKSLEGEWWLPADPSHVFKGQLTIDDQHHGQLLFRGTEEHLAKLPTGPAQPTFFGRLTNKYTYVVTLFDTSIRRRPGSTFPKKPDNETNAEFHTNSILISGHVVFKTRIKCERADRVMRAFAAKRPTRQPRIQDP